MTEPPLPRALVISRNFPPLVGGMERLNEHLVRELAPDWSVALCGPRGCGAFVAPGMTVREHAIRPLAGFLLGAFASALGLAWRLRPRRVIGGSGLVAPIVWVAARVSRAPAVLYLHGLDIIAPSRIYQWFWLPFVRAADLVLVNSGNTARLARERGVRPERIVILHPGTDLPDETGADVREAFRRRQGWIDRSVLLSVGRFTRRKGLAEFVAQALPAIVANDPATLLAIIGEEAVDALHGAGGGERVRIVAAAEAAGVASHVAFVGRCSEADLGCAYDAADVHVFPVLDLPGDVEGFGMVALESAAHGLPTVAFAVGGVPDAVVDGHTGRLVAPGDYGAFAAATLDLLRRGARSDGSRACRDFAAGKAWSVFGSRLRAALRDCA